MKKWNWIYTMFIGVMLTAIVIYVANTLNPTAAYPYDDEQEGIAEQVVIHFSYVNSEDTPKGLAVAKFAELVEEKTNGRVKVEIFPNSELFSEDEELEMLLSDNVEMIVPSTTQISSRISEWKVFDLPFIFRDFEHARTKLLGGFGEEMLAKANQPNMKAMAFWGAGFKQMAHANKSLVSVDDVSGQRMRITASEILNQQFRILHAVPIQIPFHKIYSAFEKHRFDGQEATISTIYSKKFYTQQPNITMTNHGFAADAVLMNRKFWEKLDAKVQQQISSAMEETTQWQWEQVERINAEQLEKLRFARGVKITELPNSEKRRWQDKFISLYEDDVLQPYITKITRSKINQGGLEQ